MYNNAYFEGFMDCLEEFSILNEYIDVLMETSKATKEKLHSAGFNASTRNIRGRGNVSVYGSQSYKNGSLLKARQRAHDDYTGDHLGNFYTKRTKDKDWIRMNSSSTNSLMKKKNAHKMASKNIRDMATKFGYDGPASFKND